MNPIITEMQRNKTFKAYVQGNPGVCEYSPDETIAVCKLLLRLRGTHVINVNGFSVFTTVMWTCWLVLSFGLVGGLEVNTFNGMLWGLLLLLGIFGGAIASRQ